MIKGTKSKFVIRKVVYKDAYSMLEIYRPYVLNSSVTFEYDSPSVDEFGDRIKSYTKEYPWLVCLYNGKLIGYAYASKYRQRTAYQWSVESTVYVLPGFHRKGVARILYETLFSILKHQGFMNVYAIVTTPNEQSEGFHRSLGFKEFAVFKKVGYKLGKWHDVKWFELLLNKPADEPVPPVHFAEIKLTKELKSIIAKANERINVKKNN